MIARDVLNFSKEDVLKLSKLVAGWRFFRAETFNVFYGSTHFHLQFIQLWVWEKLNSTVPPITFILIPAMLCPAKSI